MLLLNQIKDCNICTGHLPLAPRPILQAHEKSKILIIGQAPGLKAHNAQIPWNNPSGNRLRYWLGVSREQFYDPRLFAIPAPAALAIYLTAQNVLHIGISRC
jgi:hypothetical protein